MPYFSSSSFILKVVSLLAISISASLSSCKKIPSTETVDWDTICVNVTAYNSVNYQTENNPRITAWGDTLKPGMRAIAVSRDLLKMGLQHNTQVRIEGYDSIFLVKDKMHSRWRNKIDIYMGEDVEQALKFGRKKLNISFVVKKDSVQE